MTSEPPIGTIVTVDGEGQWRVEAGGFYASPRPRPTPGVRVRPVEGGRAKAGDFEIITKTKF